MTDEPIIWYRHPEGYPPPPPPPDLIWEFLPPEPPSDHTGQLIAFCIVLAGLCVVAYAALAHALTCQCN